MRGPRHPAKPPAHGEGQCSCADGVANLVLCHILAVSCCGLAMAHTCGSPPLSASAWGSRLASDVGEPLAELDSVRSDDFALQMLPYLLPLLQRRRGAAMRADGEILPTTAVGRCRVSCLTNMIADSARRAPATSTQYGDEWIFPSLGLCKPAQADCFCTTKCTIACNACAHPTTPSRSSQMLAMLGVSEGSSLTVTKCSHGTVERC